MVFRTLYKMGRAFLDAWVPSRTTLSWYICILAVVTVVAVVAFLTTFSYRHPFWTTRPVAQTTLLPRAEGRIHHDGDPPPPSPTTPEGYVVERVRRLRQRTQTDPLWTEIATLWRTAPTEDATESFWADEEELSMVPPPEAAVTSETARWSTRYPGARLFVVRTQSDGALVATLLVMPTVLDTPADDRLPVFLADRLFVHPGHRRRRLVPVLVDAAVSDARQRLGSEPVGIFAVEIDGTVLAASRLPFAEAARTMRVYQTVAPAMLVDPEAEVSHRVVQTTKELPSKAYESSGDRVHGNTHTLEPAVGDTRQAWWEAVLAHPQHTVLAVGGNDWVHLRRRNVDTSHVLVELLGHSYHSTRCTELPAQVYAFLRATYAQDKVVSQVSLVVAQPLVRVFEMVGRDTAVSRGGDEDGGGDSDSDAGGRPANAAAPWFPYDTHFLYMYNYRLSRNRVTVPFTFDLPVV